MGAKEGRSGELDVFSPSVTTSIDAVCPPLKTLKSIKMYHKPLSAIFDLFPTLPLEMKQYSSAIRSPRRPSLFPWPPSISLGVSLRQDRKTVRRAMFAAADSIVTLLRLFRLDETTRRDALHALLLSSPACSLNYIPFLSFPHFYLRYPHPRHPRFPSASVHSFARHRSHDASSSPPLSRLLAQLFPQISSK